MYIRSMKNETDIIESRSNEQAEALDAEMQDALLKHPRPAEMDYDPYI